jgi:ribosomal-protein-alanine N-acetyltransferase
MEKPLKHTRLQELYQLCFPDKRPEEEIKALGPDFKFEIMGESFIIYNILSTDQAEIIDLGTIPSARKLGMAKKLLEDTLNSLKEKGVTTVFLEVAANNHPAIALYNKCGFVDYNLRKGYYKTGDSRINAILMKKSI